MKNEEMNNQLRGYKITTLKILKQLSDNVVVTTSNIGNATQYSGKDLRGQLGTLSRKKLIQKAGFDEENSQRWQLSPDVDRDWLKNFLKELNIY
jgi:hypothetical protein